MRRKVVKKNGRDKAFIGAIVGAVAGIAGGIISAKKKAKSEALAFEQAQKEQSRIEGVASAAALNSSYANQNYVDDYNKKITLKNGGSVKIKQKDSKDRIARSKQFAMGGRNRVQTEPKRKQSALGSLIGEGGVGGEIAGASGGIAGLAGALFTKAKAPKTIKKADGFSFAAPKESITPNSYQVDAQGNPILGNMAGGELVDPRLAVNPNDPLTAKMGKKVKVKSR